MHQVVFSKRIYMFVCVCIIMLSAMIEVDKAPKIAWECDA